MENRGFIFIIDGEFSDKVFINRSIAISRGRKKKVGRLNTAESLKFDNLNEARSLGFKPFFVYFKKKGEWVLSGCVAMDDVCAEKLSQKQFKVIEVGYGMVDNSGRMLFIRELD